MTLHLRQMGFTDARTFMGPSSGKRQNIWPIGGHRNGVLEVRRGAPVTGAGGPAVAAAVDLGPAGVDRGLDGGDEAFLHAHAPRPRAVVGDLRIFVELPPDAVTDELPHERVPGALGDV